MPDFWAEYITKEEREKYAFADCRNCGYREAIWVIELAIGNFDCPGCGQVKILNFVPVKGLNVLIN